MRRPSSYNLNACCLAVPVALPRVNRGVSTFAVSTAQEIEAAIRSVDQPERHKLLQHLPQLFREVAGDIEWDRIIRDEQPRPGFNALLDLYEADLPCDRESYPKVAERRASS